MKSPLGALIGLTVCMLSACTGLSDDLRRAETAFSEARYEDVEVWLEELERDVPRMPSEQRARYYYLAGMSAYRIGARAPARHALALCREELADAPGALPPGYLRNLRAALEDLARSPR